MTSSPQLLSRDLSRPGILYYGGARMALLEVEAGFWALRRQLEAIAGRTLADSVFQQAGANGGTSFAEGFAHNVSSPAPSQAVRDCVAAFEAAGFGSFQIDTLEWPIGRLVISGRDTIESWTATRHGQSCFGPVCAYTTGVFVGLVNALDGGRRVVCIERACQAGGADACQFELLPAAAAPDLPAVGLDPDLLLGRQVNLLDVLFDRVPIGIAVFDRDHVLHRCNRTWTEYVSRYTPTPVGRITPGARLFELVPGDESGMAPLIQRALAGETVRNEGHCSASGGITSFWDMTLTPLLENGQVIGFVQVKTDATERLLARQELEQRVADRTRALSALHDVITVASASLDVETVLNGALERVIEVIEGEAGAIHLLDADDQVLRLPVSKGVSLDTQARIESVLVARGLAGEVLSGAEPLVVPSLERGAKPLLALSAKVGQAYVGVPIRSKGRPIGVLSVVRAGDRPFTPGDISLLVSIAGEMGGAVESARLYQQAEQLAIVRERERLARELHDSVTQSLYSLTLLAEAGRRWSERGDLDRVEDSLERVSEIGQQALREMRLLVYELRPLVLRREGLVGAIQHRLDAVEKRAGVDTELLVDGHLDIPSAVEEELYRIAQEALNNALKHSGASAVSVHIHHEPDQVVLRIEDNGTGFDPTTAPNQGGMGLASMRERAAKVGGTLRIDSAHGAGTTLEACVALNRASQTVDGLSDGGAR